MAWCHQATCHYQSQCWPRSVSPYGITRPQWVKWHVVNSLSNALSWLRKFVHNFVPIVLLTISPWWRHQMETFSALLAICARNSPVPGEFPAQRPVTRSFNVFFDLCLNKRMSKQSWGWWFEMLPCPLWRHCNAVFLCLQSILQKLHWLSNCSPESRSHKLVINYFFSFQAMASWRSFCRWVWRLPFPSLWVVSSFSSYASSVSSVVAANVCANRTQTRVIPLPPPLPPPSPSTTAPHPYTTKVTSQ